jgi:hypothetical protein
LGKNSVPSAFGVSNVQDLCGESLITGTLLETLFNSGTLLKSPETLLEIGWGAIGTLFFEIAFQPETLIERGFWAVIFYLKRLERYF